MYPFLGCNTDAWPDVDNGVICGYCYALININNYGTCRTYCESLGLACLNAYEDVLIGDGCKIKDYYNCDTDFYWTSDALCECTVDTATTGITNLRMKPRFIQIMIITNATLRLPIVLLLLFQVKGRIPKG